MKMFIKETLNFKTQEVAEDAVQPQEIVDYLREDFTIFAEVKNDEFIEIQKQKVTLNEIKMNELFDQIFHIFKIEYACMGGVGCEFNINVSLL